MMRQKNNNNNKNHRSHGDLDHHHHRVILLLDLDCFYAQCERVRLGLDSETCSLALLQWDAVLAVTYPARKFGIQRGDSWEQVDQKSQNKCLAIHLPVLEQQQPKQIQQQQQQQQLSNSSPSQKQQGSLTRMNEAEIKHEHDNHGDDLEGHEQQDEHDGDNIGDDDDDDDDVKVSYNKAFHLSSAQKEYVMQNEIGRKRFHSEGKACLERYRLASTRIFNVVLESLQELQKQQQQQQQAIELEDDKGQEQSSNNNQNKKTCILERASIDELFLDVTEFCRQVVYRNTKKNTTNATTMPTVSAAANIRNDKKHVPTVQSIEAAVGKTVHVGDKNLNHDKDNHDHAYDCYSDDHHNDDMDAVVDDGISPTIAMLKVGCWVAQFIRQSVYDTLGFTLSAGISTSKLVAKLGASYGKPNGQAVIYPHAIPYVMDRTNIRKVRGFGRKAGRQVVSLLPHGTPPTMGNVVKFLSLPELVHQLGSKEMAQQVYNNARGIDYEVVQETVGALVKSITAFKSFTSISLNSREVWHWFQLLAKDVCQRVQQDLKRNHRYPKSCTVQYNFTPHCRNRVTKSVRIAFPKERKSTTTTLSSSSQQQQEEELATRAKECIILREGENAMLNRIGLAAMDFEMIGYTGGKSIESFFEKMNTNKSTHCHEPDLMISSSSLLDPQRGNLKRSASMVEQDHKYDDGKNVNQPKPQETTFPRNTLSLDEDMARLLESEYKKADNTDDAYSKSTTPGNATTNIRKNTTPTSKAFQPNGNPTAMHNHHSNHDHRTATPSTATSGGRMVPSSFVDKDMELAKKLQATYDREHSLHSAMDQQQRKKRGSLKRTRIDSFFLDRTKF